MAVSDVAVLAKAGKTWVQWFLPPLLRRALERERKLRRHAAEQAARPTHLDELRKQLEAD